MAALRPTSLIRTAMRTLGKIAAAAAVLSITSQANAVDFNNPTDNGGRWLTSLNEGTQIGEPLNIVISGDSDPLVLTIDESKPGGFYTYWE